MLLLAACTSADSSTPASSGVPTSGAAISGAVAEPSLIFPNQGDDLEGHTPRGFAGTGTGLFVGDNLNPGFPDGDGVQTYMTFDIGSVSRPASAVLSSDALNVRGNPFEDLGPLIVELVEYETFGPDLFDLVAVSPSVPCRLVGDSGVACDVTSLVDRPLREGVSRLQFRLKFTEAGDSDGEADLAMFFVEDSNSNESGLFNLTLGG